MLTLRNGRNVTVRADKIIAIKQMRFGTRLYFENKMKMDVVESYQYLNRLFRLCFGVEVGLERPNNMSVHKAYLRFKNKKIKNLGKRCKRYKRENVDNY